VVSILEFVAHGNGVSVLASLTVPEPRPGLVFRSDHAARRASGRPRLLDAARLSRQRGPSGTWRGREAPGKQ
jgi:hypothetical protein